MEWKKADEPASYHLFRENGYSPLVASALAKAGLTDLEQVKIPFLPTINFSCDSSFVLTKLVRGLSIFSDHFFRKK